MREDTVILIAEDDAGHFALVKKNLWRTCVTSSFMHFRNGQEVLDFLLGKGDGPKITPNTPYVLLLDIRMPKVDGIEVLHQIKADPELRRIPVIMLTTTTEPTEVQRAYDAGCSFYIVKPSDYSEFMACVEHIGALLSLEGVKVPLVYPSGRTGAEQAE
ncbi:MAG TPA: response regulator [Anaerohalosphaeraceae bacterium]|jgi:CheY-like chemotaxis protein|nr:response regulator [Anaerohalosphaeraceae bacterium]HRT49310.1 response regulator [Anaerohalosphaeraceae bacterium]HRT85961.1 response regulator [Anaerohalosphaeraceae bacterium]